MWQASINGGMIDMAPGLHIVNSCLTCDHGSVDFDTLDSKCLKYPDINIQLNYVCDSYSLTPEEDQS